VNQNSPAGADFWIINFNREFMIPKISSHLKTAGLYCLIVVCVTDLTQAQRKDQDWKNETQVAILFGLTQPLVANGFNIEGNFIHHRLIFDYSHGASLEFTGDLLTTDLKDRGVVVHVPWTTGLGIGYRFTHWLNVRAEPKWHRFEFYYDGEQQNKINRITAYNTFTMGVGLYAFLQPFKKKTNFLKGIAIAPSVRFWPTVSSTLKGKTYQYSNKNTGGVEEIETLDPGVGFTPLIINVSVGYAFRVGREK
jgi:hypothetical protein